MAQKRDPIRLFHIRTLPQFDCNNGQSPLQGTCMTQPRACQGECFEHPPEGRIRFSYPVDHVYHCLHDTEGALATVLSAMERLWTLGY